MFTQGDHVRWSDTFLAHGKTIDPTWFDREKNSVGVVDRVQRDGDVLVYWNGSHETCVHPPERLEKL